MTNSRKVPWDDLFLASRLVGQGVTSREKVGECLSELLARLDRGGEAQPRLGDLLAEKGYATVQQIQATIQAAAADATLKRDASGVELAPGHASAYRPDSAFTSRYAIGGEIARGGMGIILDGKDLDIRRELAIKVLIEENAGPEAAVERNLRETNVVTRQQDRTLEARLGTLRETSKLNIVLDAGVPQDVQRRLSENRVLPVEGGPVEALLRQVCVELDLGFCVTEERVVLVTTRERADEARKAREEAAARRAECLARLDRRIEGPLPTSMPDLVQALERITDLQVRVSERVWDSRAEYAVPSGLTVREALDLVARAGGFRWASDPHFFSVD